MAVVGKAEKGEGGCPGLPAPIYLKLAVRPNDREVAARVARMYQERGYNERAVGAWRLAE